MGAAFGVGLALAIWVIETRIIGGRLDSFVLITPLLFVLGGTLSALLIAYPASAVASMPRLIARAFRGPSVGTEPEPTAIFGEVTARLEVALFRDAGTFALLSGAIAFLLAVVVVLSHLGNSSIERIGEGIAVSVMSVIYALVLATFCYAVSANLRHKGQHELGATTRVLAGGASAMRGTPEPVGTP